MARLLVEAEQEKAAQETAERLHRACVGMLETHPLWKKRTLLLRLDQPPVKLLRGKCRWHVLMKLLDHPDTEPLVGALTELARQESPGADIYFEYNPTTMM